MSYSFGNDYSVLVCDEILEAINKYASEENIPYGEDYHSKNAKELIRSCFNTDGDVYFLAGGTQTNLVGLSSMLKSYEGIIAADTSHINVHETGAVEGTGHKIYTVKNFNGKLRVEDIKECLEENNNCHTVKYKAVYISYPTETGSIYSKQELTSIYNFCKAHDLYLFIDGARLAVGLTSDATDIEASDIAKNSDMFYIGGTKNGMLLGEALVITNDKLKEDFRYHIKNKGAMLAKGYLVGIEFERAFQDSLYLKLGSKTNNMSKILQQRLKSIGYECYSDTNQIFISVSEDIAFKLIKEFHAEKWGNDKENVIVRLVTSFKTSKEDINLLIESINV